MGEGDILSFMGDFNSRLKRCDGKRTAGTYMYYKYSRYIKVDFKM